MKISAFEKIFSAVLCLALLWSVIPPAQAAGEPEGAREVILQAYEELEAAEGLELTVELEKFSLTVDQLNQLITGTGLYGDCSQPWYLASYTYRYYETSGIVRSLTLVRKDPQEYDYDLLNQKMAEILDATVQEGMSQWQIILSIHDYLVANCVYDETYTYRTFYDVLTRGTAVCSGYAEALMYLLQEVGIECRYVHSEKMNHAWNIVKLDGNWYHIDTTWDDPTSDVRGRVLHDLFLHSDEVMADEEHKHYDWEAPFECTDTSLDTGRFWQNIDSAICYESADICYFRQETEDQGFVIYRRDREGNETQLLRQDTGYVDIGAADGYRYYYASYGLSLVEGKLYYCDMQGVYRINTDGSGKETLYRHDCAANGSFIQGIHVSGGKIHLTLSTQEGVRSAMTLDLPEAGHTHSYTAQVVAPTCQAIGYTQYTCECGVSYQAQKKAALEHTFDEGTVILEPTLGQPGLKEYTCKDCGYTETEEIPALVGNDSLPGGEEDLLENKTVRRILIGVGIVALALIFRRKR